MICCCSVTRCCCSVMSDSLWCPWTAALQASMSFPISQSLLKLMSIESMMPSNYFILCHPLPLLPSTFPSIRVFSNESTIHIRWPGYWRFSFSPSNEYSGLISFSFLDKEQILSTIVSLLVLSILCHVDALMSLHQCICLECPSVLSLAN